MEIQFNSLNELQELAKEKGKAVDSFRVTKTSKPCTYHFVTIEGPGGICKVEANFSDLS